MHIYQKDILRKATFKTKYKFSELKPDNMTSKHFNYHLSKLIEQDYIEKYSSYYQLTSKGKDYVSRLDESKISIEHSPKVSVMLFPFRNNKSEVLVNKRLKHPYFGKIGDFTGKIKFGENVLECAKRELKEESGLTGKFTLSKIVRKIAYDDDKKIVQDNFLFIFCVEDLRGKLIKNPGDQENFWLKVKDVKKTENLYNTYNQFLQYALNSNDSVDEYVVEAEGF